MYAQYFGLRESPFALPPDPRYLYLSLRHQEALAHLMYGITEGGGFALLTGEVGTGKTMMIRALLERLPNDVDAALVLYPFLSVREFVAAICDDLRVPAPANAEGTKPLIDALNRYLLENHAKGRRTVLIIDEAQKLSHEVLEQIRLLTNLETTKHKLLQILLIGQPELNNLLAQDGLRQLEQRVTARYNLRALLPNETAEYVAHRCRVAGARNGLFTRGAIQTVHRWSRGTPRLINVICDRALLGAYGHGRNCITASIVRNAITELATGPRSQSRTWAWQTGVAIAAMTGIAFGTWHWVMRANPTPPTVAVATTPVAGVAATPVAVADDALTEGGDVAPNEPPPPTLAELLDDPAIPTTTEAAFVSLFSQWQRDYHQLPGKTGCERAEQVGLRCAFSAGSWSNLRQFNRPAVIELVGPTGAKHHVLVKGMEDDQVTIEIAGKPYEFPLVEVDRYWFGKFLLLWGPPPTGEDKLARGMRGPAISWLRQALANYHDQPLKTASEVFDADLEEQVKEFQRRHNLDDDGIVGRNTLILFDAYDAAAAQPLVVRSISQATTIGSP